MTRTTPPPPAIDGVRIATVGTSLWTVAFVVTLVVRPTLVGSNDWRVTAATAGVGAILGLIGIAFLRRFGHVIAAR